MTCCAECDRVMHHSARDPVCLTCRTSRRCRDCDAPVSHRSTGRCRTCANAALMARPEVLERRRAGTVAHNTDPALGNARRAAARKAVRTKRANPETMARLSAAGRNHGAKNIDATRTPEARAKAGRAISAVKQAQRRARLAWCPPDRIAEYERLANDFGVSEARRIIEADLAAQRSASIAASHQRMLAQQSRLRGGVTA